MIFGDEMPSKLLIRGKGIETWIFAIGGRGIRTFLLLYDLTLSLYIAYKEEIYVSSSGRGSFISA